jgi:hypothetical protein
MFKSNFEKRLAFNLYFQLRFPFVPLLQQSTRSYFVSVGLREESALDHDSIIYVVRFVIFQKTINLMYLFVSLYNFGG